LEEEKKKLESRLSQIASPNPQNPDDWETKIGDLNIMPADPSELADSFEEMGTLSVVETNLEDRLNDVKAALKRIDDGTYGKCEVNNCPIEEDRLKADPTATTCVKHADKI
jgi:RNA polymerase-binding transcription factor DksA